MDTGTTRAIPILFDRAAQVPAREIAHGLPLQPSRFPGMGATLHGDVCAFRLWAPNASRVRVRLRAADGSLGFRDLASERNGYWSADVPGIAAGQRYKFEITNNAAGPCNPGGVYERFDPYARWVENSAFQSECLVDDPSHPWAPFVTPAFSDLIIYQLHVGSFARYPSEEARRQARPSRFSDLLTVLDYVRGLGCNAVQLLPLAEFPFDKSAGYNPSDFFAPESAYGTPDELRRLVDEAHRRGLAVLFDVVYNHIGDTDNALWQYDGMDHEGGIYIEGGGGRNDWGWRPAHWKREVRDFFLDNARMYLRDFRADGLRFDAAQEVPREVLQEWTYRLRAEFPGKYLVAEHCPLSPAVIEDRGFDAAWHVGSHGDFVAALCGDDPLGRLKGLLGWDGYRAPWNLVKYLLGSHDDCWDGRSGGAYGHRYLVECFGGRGEWGARARARLAWAVNATLPGTPMLFMGNECHNWGYWTPDPDKNGDHRFNWDLAEDEIGQQMRRLVAGANQLRWDHPALRTPSLQIVHEDPQNRVLAFKRWNQHGDVVLVVVNLGEGQWGGGDYRVNLAGDGGTWREVFNSQAPEYGGWSGSGNPGRLLRGDGGALSVNLPKLGVLAFARAE